MSAADISPGLRAFIARHINSVEQVEALLLLRRTRPRAWNAERLAAELRTSVMSAEQRLHDLASRGLIERRQGDYVYAPESAELEDRVEELADAYVTYRYTIIELIFAKPMDNIRSLAQAFRLRKGEDDG